MSHSRHRMISRLSSALTATALGAAGLAAVTAPAHATGAMPHYDHVVVVMEENHSYSDIIGSASAPYINNTLAAGGALFTQSFAVEHPSQPNYLDLFSGSNQGVTDDSCPHTFSTDNEAAQLLAAGHTFTGYAESLPSAGSTACTSGAYARKHAPWTNFTNVPAADSQPFSSFPTDFTTLPTVSWVVPNLNDDMHDGTIAQGDTWLQNNIDAYAQWAKTHNSLLVVTWDEDDYSQSNQVPTLFYGANVKTGRYSEKINHFNVLRTVEDLYGLPYAGAAASATPITDVWSTSPEVVSVTSPGNQTTTVNTAIAPLQIQASDSAGSSLTYSATGLPAGLSISSSGQITGTPTTVGTNSVTVTASSGTALGSQSFTWTVGSSVLGTHSLVNVNSGMCLDITGSSKTAGTDAIQWTCTGNANQQWTLTPVSGSTTTYTLSNVNSGMCLDITGSSKTAGAYAIQWTCTGHANQEWTIR